MDREEKVLQEYILYVQHKENFVNRTFDANKFYLISALVVLCIAVPVVFIPFANIFGILFSIIGMVLCILWKMNINAYKRLLKIKFQNVIERLEDELPVKPYQMESEALKEQNQTKGFMFADMQTILSFVIFVAFAATFVFDIIVKFQMFY
ncbi:hypothetical protein IJ732_06040 [bacterium]|nr:hypothetical protein [bacterium]